MGEARREKAILYYSVEAACDVREVRVIHGKPLLNTPGSSCAFAANRVFRASVHARLFSRAAIAASLSSAVRGPKPLARTQSRRGIGADQSERRVQRCQTQ